VNLLCKHPSSPGPCFAIDLQFTRLPAGVLPSMQGCLSNSFGHRSLRTYVHNCSYISLDRCQRPGYQTLQTSNLGWMVSHRHRHGANKHNHCQDIPRNVDRLPDHHRYWNRGDIYRAIFPCPCSTACDIECICTIFLCFSQNISSGTVHRTWSAYMVWCTAD
jgi:hypothetical protein